MLRFSIPLLALALVSGAPATAQDQTPLPDRLTFGYQDEGAVDASPAACLAFVKEVTLWNEADAKRGADEVCAARRHHLQAYNEVQRNYRRLAPILEADRRLNGAASMQDFQTMIKACINHKYGLSTGGHNIRIDIIPNDIAAECLRLGADLLARETTALTGP